LNANQGILPSARTAFKPTPLLAARRQQANALLLAFGACPPFNAQYGIFFAYFSDISTSYST
jgi:hypothetical protein